MNEVVLYDKEPRVGTFVISKGFKRDHSSVVDLVRKYLDKFIRLEVDRKDIIKIKIQADTAGRPVEEYLLNEAQVMLLASLFRESPAVMDFKLVLCKAFQKSTNLISAVKDALENFDFGDINVRYIYVAQDESGRLKIGISNDPENRVKHLNIGNADILKLVYVKEAMGEGYSDETKLHQACKKHHIHGEWFGHNALELLNG